MAEGVYMQCCGGAGASVPSRHPTYGVRAHGPLLVRRVASPSPECRDDGRGVVAKSNLRWGSDGSKFGCNNDGPLRVYLLQVVATAKN
jgi:hypothetical protein